MFVGKGDGLSNIIMTPPHDDVLLNSVYPQPTRKRLSLWPGIFAVVSALYLLHPRPFQEAIFPALGLPLPLEVVVSSSAAASTTVAPSNAVLRGIKKMDGALLTPARRLVAPPLSAALTGGSVSTGIHPPISQEPPLPFPPYIRSKLWLPPASTLALSFKARRRVVYLEGEAALPPPPKGESEGAGGEEEGLYPRLATTSVEAPFFDLSVNNPGLKALELFPKTLSPLALLPYPPGLPSLAAYKTAVVSPTFKAMERWNSAWAKANSESLAEYTLHKDPLHAWSRKYEYVWAAEVARAAVEASPSHKDLSTKLEDTWPSSPVQQGVGNGASSEAFKVMDLGSGFTFFPQYLASRLGVAVTALDHSGDLKAFYGAQPLSPMDGEEGGSSVSFITGSMDAMSDVPSGSFDYILCVGTLDTISDVGLTVREVHRVLKRGGRFAFTFNSGQDGIAQSPKAAAKLLDVVRGVMTEDVTHGAPSELLGGGAARFLFTNHKARPPEFLEKTFSVSCHVFVKV